VLLAFTRGTTTWSQWAEGVGTAAYLALTTAAVLGAIAGPILLPSIRRAASRVGAGWAAIRRGEVDARQGLAARALALPLLLLAWGSLAYETAQAVVFGFARPDTMAAGMTLATVGLALTLLFFWSLLVGWMKALVRVIAPVRGFRWLLRRAWPVPSLVGLGAVACAVVAGWIARKELASLPWLQAAPLLGLVGGIAIATYLPRAPRWLRNATAGLTLLVLALGAVAGMRMRPESSTAQRLAFERALSGRAGYSAWGLALDFDRDGQLSMLGGGDCAPFDARRFTGAPDVPNNGIDEDCDGVDLSPQAIAVRPALSLRDNVVPKTPTIVLVTIDALTAMKLKAIGRHNAVMPRLDELANRSAVFSACFAQGPSTRMSFPSLFTSRWDSQQSFEYSPRLPYSFSDKERSLQDTFDDANYDTVAVIPNVYFDPGRWPSVTRGFKEVDSSALRSPSGKHDAVEVTDAALRVLSEPRDRPLYLWAHYFDAHPPYAPPPGFHAPDHKDETFYDEELAYIDKELGRLIDAIDHRAEPTYLIVTSDHATSFYPIEGVRHWNYGYDIYTSTLHVPLIIHGPGVRTSRFDDVVSTMDVAPTLANLASLNMKGRFEGTSLLPEALEGKTDPLRTTFHEYYLPENEFRGHGDPLEFVSLRTDKYDLVLNRKHGSYELYDWRADYWEEHDLYEERARTPEVARLRSLLGAFIYRYAAHSALHVPSASNARNTFGARGYSAVEP
jgi:arylsulfatase A-like enzyme